MFKNTNDHYGSVTKCLHWLVAILVICLLLVGYFMGGLSSATLRSTVFHYHKLTGLFVLLLMFLRVLWALCNVKPVLSGTPLWQRIAERVVHFSLYALLIVMPLSGWIMSVASGYTPELNGVALSLPVPKSEAIAGAALSTHYWLAIAIIALVSLHVLAALYHHFIKKDGILRRMAW